MKKKKLDQMKDKSVQELEKELGKLRSELVDTSAKISVGKEKNLKVARHIRKDIAQILTIINKQRNEKNEQAKKGNIKK